LIAQDSFQEILLPEGDTRKFEKKYRIKKKEEISFLFRNGKQWRYPNVSFYAKENNKQHDRVAVLVGRDLGNAVTRNAIKRLFRELFRIHKRIQPPFYDILIRPRVEIKATDHRVIESCYREWMKKAGTFWHT
jgi:ribonuclease P protein component